MSVKDPLLEGPQCGASDDGISVPKMASSLREQLKMAAPLMVNLISINGEHQL